MIGVSQLTACRTATRVTDAFVTRVKQWIFTPTKRQAEQTKCKFRSMQHLGNVISCVDATHIRIQAPYEQVICDADLLFITVVAKWPGSVHDARILQESPLFAAFESGHPPLDGVLLGDSGYMLRTWLMAPVSNPESAKERRYNFAPSSTRSTVERCIGVAKQRFQCLRVGLRLQPPRACGVILACLMLHNRARRLKIPDPSTVSDCDPSSDSDAGDSDDDTEKHQNLSERARLVAGKTARDRIINFNNF